METGAQPGPGKEDGGAFFTGAPGVAGINHKKGRSPIEAISHGKNKSDLSIDNYPRFPLQTPSGL